MAKHTIKGFIVWEKWHSDDKGKFVFGAYKPSDMSDYMDRVLVCEHSTEVEIPDDFDPTPGLIASLEAQKKELRLKLARELMEIDTRISKLQALTMDEPKRKCESCDGRGRVNVDYEVDDSGRTVQGTDTCDACNGEGSQQ